MKPRFFCEGEIEGSESFREGYSKSYGLCRDHLDLLFSADEVEEIDEQLKQGFGRLRIKKSDIGIEMDSIEPFIRGQLVYGLPATKRHPRIVRIDGDFFKTWDGHAELISVVEVKRLLLCRGKSIETIKKFVDGTLIVEG